MAEIPDIYRNRSNISYQNSPIRPFRGSEYAHISPELTFRGIRRLVVRSFSQSEGAQSVVVLDGGGFVGIQQLTIQDHIGGEGGRSSNNKGRNRNPFSNFAAFILPTLPFLLVFKLVRDGVHASRDSALIGLLYVAIAFVVSLLAVAFFLFFVLDLLPLYKLL